MTPRQPLHILCIEDSPGEARLMERHLTRAGFKMTWAATGAQGLAQQAAGGFDGVLVDHRLPDMPGMEVLRILLEREPLLPVVMVTGRGDEETAVKAMKLGAQDYLVKDVDSGFIELLPAVIEQAMVRQQLVLDKKHAEQVAQRREAILEAVTFVAAQLLQTTSWQDQMNELLARLGQAAGVSRVYLVENGASAYGERFIKKCYEWTAPSITPRAKTYKDKTYDQAGLTRWVELFTQDQLIHGPISELPEPERTDFTSQGVLSMIAVPVFVESTWWGFIGFDDCKTERVWESAEMDALRTPAKILGAALQRQRAESALYQAQRLESMGLLAGGIAHDFNNLLTGILSQTSLALLKLPADASATPHIHKTVQAAEQAADLVRQLLGYAGKGQFQLRPIDLGQLLHDSTGLLDSTIRKQAALQLDLAQETIVVEVDRGQIQQVILNLVLNATEAVSSRIGTIRITTRQYRTTESLPSVGNYALQPDFYACLEISDTGEGMKAETLPRIFDPFFTTKATGRGLGLSAILGIVRAHSGGIQVESEWGKGSRFRIFLPVSGKQAEYKPTVPPQGGKIHAKILLIDDEPTIREAVLDGLEMLGVEVLLAENGHEGIALYQKYHQSIDLILLDMQMPGINGREAFLHLRKINPQAKVILSSGYSETDSIRGFTKKDIVAFLQKPYRFEKLIAEIRAALVDSPKT
jgi:DNA-binding response OmpR family regulator/signal transduction histidine kinase